MSFERLRPLTDADYLPALRQEYVHRRPAAGLGNDQPPPRILLLYGSLRERSYSRLVVEECARLLQFFGCETRIFNPADLPLPDQVAGDDHPAVHELCEHSLWSEGHVWCSPEYGSPDARFAAMASFSEAIQRLGGTFPRREWARADFTP